MITEELVDRLVAATNEAKDLLPELHGAVKDARRLLGEAAAERRQLELAIGSASTEGLDERAQAAAADFGATIERMISEAEKTVRRRIDVVGRLSNLLPSDAPAAPGRRCPHCRGLIEESTGLNLALVPSDGDISICARCGGISRFDEGTQRMRRQTKAEEQEARENPEIQAAVRSIRAFKTRRR